jgi:arylformamidase
VEIHFLLIQISRARDANEIIARPQATSFGFSISTLTRFESDNYYAAHNTVRSTSMHKRWKVTNDESYSMRIYDVSVPLSAATPTYPGDPGIEIKNWLTLAKGDAANVSVINFGLHSGTHVDAPSHFIEGAAKVDSLPLEILIGEAEVVEVADHIRVIDESFVAANCMGGSKRILFKTRNSTFWGDTQKGFREDYVYINENAARRLVETGIRLVGIDYLSVEQFKSENFQTHHALLSSRVVILEGLDLREVPSGLYELICLPLKVAGGSGDGAPARVILRTLN